MDWVFQMVRRVMLVVTVMMVMGCEGSDALSRPTEREALVIDPSTGIPYAYTFQFPIAEFDTSDFGFGFGDVNTNFCLEKTTSGCVEYGAHTGRDTIVSKTPVGTEVVAPADGIVRLSTNLTYGGYGADAVANPSYRGCLLLIEHEFPNGQPVTTLLGHLQCESGTTYSASTRTGNPSVDTIVSRGQYVGRVAHYWHGAGTTMDWHHLHWAMRVGAFSSSQIARAVKGYVPQSEFTTDPLTYALEHGEWLDPFVVIAANGDPAASADRSIRHHPPGSLLESADGEYYLVATETMLSPVPPDVRATDRYDRASAVQVTAEELACYTVGAPVASLGQVVLYVRPGSSTVVMAYAATRMRYDVIRWEALLSWGYGTSDLTTDAGTITQLESTYAHAGMRTLRMGTLVKADETSEVSIVTPAGTRLPIASGDLFESLGYRWERIVSIPSSVIDVVAGSRAATVVDEASITACAVAPPCPGGGTCGGGGVTDVDAGVSLAARVHITYTGAPETGPITLLAWWQPPNAFPRMWGVVTDCADTTTSDRELDCTFDLPHGTSSFEFQIALPNGAFWGDLSCDVHGGCGQPVGTVTVSADDVPLEHVLTPNNTSGLPYMNGFVNFVP